MVPGTGRETNRECFEGSRFRNLLYTINHRSEGLVHLTVRPPKGHYYYKEEIYHYIIVGRGTLKY